MRLPKRSGRWGGEKTPPVIIKGGLAREESEFDKNTENLAHGNASRTDMVNKAKGIFDMASGFDSKGPIFRGR